MKFRLLALSFLLLVPSLRAQVGVLPTESPFRDLDTRMEITLFSGTFKGALDPVGISPQDGPYFGARYDVRFGPTIQLTSRLAMVPTQRSIVDPTLNAADRNIGTQDISLYMMDLGLSFNLSGGKAYKNLVPVAGVGLGLASDFETRDAGGYRMGTNFMITLSGGVKWLIGNNLQLRADVTDHMYQIRYPSTFFLVAQDGTRARRGDDMVYTNNIALSLGLSFRFFR